jgi:uncharacterized protein
MTPHPRIGIGYRSPLAGWTKANLHRFDVLEITVDHFIHGGAVQRRDILDLVGSIDLNAHGVGLSIGTDVPLDFANLLPLPKTETVAEMIVEKICAVQARIPVPFLLENISYVFEWPDSKMSDAEFLNLICRETSAGLLLDIENLFLNAANHGFDAQAFLDDLSPGLVREIHMAGGTTVHDARLPGPFHADSHSHPMPPETLDLLDRVLARHAPATIILERDDRLEATDEILDDVARIRARVTHRSANVHDKALVGSAV